jgi:hypothetical protein
MRDNCRFFAGLIFGAILGLTMAGGLTAARQEKYEQSQAQDDPELARLYDQDQADRSPAEGKAIDWEVVGRRDREREARVKELYEAGGLRTGKDYHRAAMVLQHAPRPEDYLLAHEFCVVALAKGERAARWLAAAAEDRFLMNINRPQRFGTQYRSTGPDDPVKLYEVGSGVTDALRKEMDVPTLAQAREREAKMQELSGTKKPLPKP